MSTVPTVPVAVTVSLDAPEVHEHDEHLEETEHLEERATHVEGGPVHDEHLEVHVHEPEHDERQAHCPECHVAAVSTAAEMASMRELLEKLANQAAVPAAQMVVIEKDNDEPVENVDEVRTVAHVEEVPIAEVPPVDQGAEHAELQGRRRRWLR